jgi:hypothetical protein
MFRSGHIQFCREFQALSFDNKKDLNCRDNRGDNLKILMGPFFLGHPLLFFSKNLACHIHIKLNQKSMQLFPIF